MFKIYSNGLDFISENKDILDSNPIETSFFILNAKSINKFNVDSYIFKFYNENNYLLVLYLNPYNLLLYGDISLCNEAANVLCDYNLKFKSILASIDLANEFLFHYENRLAGLHNIHLPMDMMYCDNLNEFNKYQVFRADETMIDEIFELKIKFGIEANVSILTMDAVRKSVINNIKSYYCISIAGKIVAMAKRSRDDDKICAISDVYTLKEYRSNGYAKSIVSAICRDILNDGKTPYLYVDKNNPISNHVYSSLGFIYANSKYEIHYKNTNIETIILAGGCFWCAAKPYYEYDGINRVLSGYIGGNVINPTYDLVKTDTTGHKEAVLIEYDTNIINYKEILDIYFNTIDPFDDGGQFIDRGTNYSLAIYSSNKDVIEYAINIISEVEKSSGKKCYISLCDSDVFYKAEEYHQDYAINNPKEMEEELITSGRKNKYFNFNLNVVEGMDILTTLYGKDLLLKNVYFYDGPISMQMLEYGGIQSTFNYNLIINCKNGFIACDEILYDNKLYKTKDFVSEFNDLINLILPN